MIINTEQYKKIFHGEYKIEAGDLDVSGYAELSFGVAVAGASAAGIASGTYKLKVNIDGVGLLDKNIIVTGTSMTWAQIATALTASLTGATASIIGGKLRVTSTSGGVTSTIALAEGTTAGFLAAVDLVGKYITTIEVPVNGLAATSGYATISNTGVLGAFTGATVPAIPSNNYAIDITVNSTLRQVVVAIVNTDSWTVITASIQTALRALTTSTETVAIDAGKIKVTSATTGVSSTILIATGTGVAAGGDLLAAINALGANYIATLDAPVAGTNATSGIAEVSTSPVTLISGTAAGLAAATYKLSVNIDGGGAADKNIVVTGTTMTWGQIATALTASLTGAVASITGGRLRVTSSSTGATSTIVIADGSTAGILAAITALVGTFVSAIETPVAGIEGTFTVQIDTPSSAKKFSHKLYVKTSAGVHKSGFTSVYDVSTGYLTITDTPSGSSLATNDTVIVQGVMYK